MAGDANSRDDLLIVEVELRADEDVSAQRIREQLPRIAARINRDSEIKLAVGVDIPDAAARVKEVSKKISAAARTNAPEIKAKISAEGIDKLRQELRGLGVSDAAFSAITEKLDDMGVKVGQVSQRWKEVGADQHELLQLIIDGTDANQRAVRVMQTYDEATGEVKAKITEITTDFKAQEAQIRRNEAIQKKANDDRLASLDAMKTRLENVRASYSADMGTTAKPVLDEGNLEDLGSKYDAIVAKIAQYESAVGGMSKAQKAEVNSMIADLERLSKHYQHVEYSATQLRTKRVPEIKAEEMSNLDAFAGDLQKSDTLLEMFGKKLEGVRAILAGAFDRTGITNYLDAFDQLKSEVATAQGQMKAVKDLFRQIEAAEGNIVRIEGQIAKLDPQRDAGQIEVLRQKQDAEMRTRDALYDQVTWYRGVLPLTEQTAELEQRRARNAEELAQIQARQADEARQAEAQMQTASGAIEELKAKMQGLPAPTKEMEVTMRTLKADMQALEAAQARFGAAESNADRVAAWREVSSLIGKCRTEITTLTRAQNGGFRDFKLGADLEKASADLDVLAQKWSALGNNEGLRNQLRDLRAELTKIRAEAGNDATQGQAAQEFKKWKTSLGLFKSQVKAAGLDAMSFADSVKQAFSKLTQWMSATTLLFRTFRIIKQGIQTVVALDTAMIDLKKTTDATEAEYRAFFKTANETAKELNMTTEAVISQTAEWSRLGYSMEEASELAQNSAIFAAVSPEMSIEEATDGLVAILKAFDDIEASDALDGIVSKINILGNKLAVTNKDLVEVMTRASSAMRAANTSFEETLAIATAAVEVTRDADSVGNALKTVSMRIRGYDETTEEYSDDVAILTGKIANLTKVASNSYAGVSLFEPGDPETYRSIYDILADIAHIWDELTDKNQAQLLEIMFGKRQGQIGSAILSNFGSAEKAMREMASSAGSAMEEFGLVQETVQYKLNRLKETWTGVAVNLFDTDQMGAVVDALTGVSGVIETITDKLGLLGTTLAGIAIWRTTSSIS